LVLLFSRGEMSNEKQTADILTQMEGIRCQVAHSMIAKTRNGKRVLNHQQQNYQRATLVQGGSLSALQTWTIHQKILSTKPPVYSTGCRALDELIAFPNEYFSHNPGIRETNGLHRGYVLQLTGISGKTQLALQLATQVVRLSAALNDDRVRYCYSTAGHSGCSLAQRFLQLLGNGNERLSGDLAKKIEFQPIATVSQLVSTLAKLEEEWLHHSKNLTLCSIRKQQQSDLRKKGVVTLLVLDALPLMLIEREGIDVIQSLERCLRRLAQHHSVLIVTTGIGNSNNIAPDIHLHIQKLTSTTSSIRLIRHPAKFATEKDCITLLHSSKCGISTPE